MSLSIDGLSNSDESFPWQQDPLQEGNLSENFSVFVSGFQDDYTYRMETIFAIYVNDIVSALRIQLPDTSNITQREFLDVILHHKIPVTMCLLAVMGLPSTGKTSAIEKMFKESIKLKKDSTLTIDDCMGRKRNEQCLSIYELCVLGGFPHYKYAWSFATNRFGAIYSIICSLTRRDPSIAKAKFELTKEAPTSLTDKHIQWLMQEVSIHLGNIKDERGKLTLIQNGLSLINVMDIGVNRALYDFLSIMLFSCHKHFRLVFFSLDRDAPNLDKIPDLPHNRYGDTNDDNIVMRQRPRVTYLLHFATLGYKKEDTNAPHNTIMVGTKKRSVHTDMPTALEENKLKQAKQEILKHAKQQGVDEFLMTWELVDLDDKDSLKKLRKTLQNIIKRVEQFKVELPLRWIVLRSLVSSLKPCHAAQSKMIIVDKQSIIEEAMYLKMGPKEVEDFLIAFTEFGSILYMPHFDDIKHLVIVDIYEFAQLLHKLFYPSNPEAEYAKRLLKHGIISLEDVNNILDVTFEVVSCFMQILSSFAIIAEIQSVIIHQKVIKSDVSTAPLYYLPSAKNGQNYIPSGVDDDCAFLEVKSVNFPANFQACITQGIMNNNEDAILIATEYCNVSRFQFQSQGKPNVQIDIIYEGQKFRLVIRHPSIDDSTFDAIVDACSKVLCAFCHCLQRTGNRIRDLKHNVAIIQCCANRNIQHHLYCDQCFSLCNACLKDTPQNKFRCCWAEAAKKCRELRHTRDGKAKQNSLALKFEEIVKYAETTIEESDVQNLVTALDLGDYKVPEYNDKRKKITSILLKWEEVKKEEANKAALDEILYEIPYSFAPLKVGQKETVSEEGSSLTGEAFEKEHCEKLLQLTDNLDCLSVQVAKKELFLVQGDKPQLMNWERFGLRIGVEEDSLSSSETVEVATAALVGGEFKFPKNTVLVSAVYAVTVSKRLLKPLRLEIQHCVDLTGQPGLSKYLKFAIAPMSTHSLPYQFRIIEGGEFSSDSQYGSIQHKEFSLVCILEEETTNGVPVVPTDGDTDEEEEEEQQQQQEEEDEKEEEEQQQEEEKKEVQQEEEEEEEKEEEEKDEQQQNGKEDKTEDDDDDSSSDSSSESNKTSDPPVASSGTKESVKGKEHHQRQKEKTSPESVTDGSPLAVTPLNVTENESEVVTEAKPEIDPINKEEIKTEIDTDSPSFIEKQTKWINGIHTKIILSLIYAVFLLLILMPFSQFYSRNFDAPLPGAQVIAFTRFLVAGGQSSQLQWEKFGLVMNVPYDALPRGFLAEIIVRVSLSGPYKYPDPETWKPASAVYWISSSKDFVNPIELRLSHNVRDKVNHWSMKVLTAEDNPQNMTYIFKELPNFELEGPYIFLLLNHFSGLSVCTTAETNIFRGSLLYKKSSKYKYCWDYKLIFYQCYPDGIQELLSKGHPGWSVDIETIDMIFEEDSTHMNLSTEIDMPVQDWHVVEKTSPLRCYKKLLQHNIEGNMHFALLWRGEYPPTRPYELRFPVTGTVLPTFITVLTNTIDDDSSILVGSSTEKFLDVTNLGDIMSALRKVNFDMHTWEDLCLKLGLFQTTIDTIEKDEHGDCNDCLKSCLMKWLNRNDEVDKKGGAKWTVLISALKHIGQIPAAEKLNEIIKDYESCIDSNTNNALQCTVKL